MVLVDVNICFFGNEALQKLQRFYFKFRSLFLLLVEIYGAEKINHNALFDSSACDVRSTSFWNRASTWNLDSYWNIKAESLLVQDAFVSEELSLSQEAFPGLCDIVVGDKRGHINMLIFGPLKKDRVPWWASLANPVEETWVWKLLLGRPGRHGWGLWSACETEGLKKSH